MIEVIEQQRVDIPQIWRDIVMLTTGGWDPAEEVIWVRNGSHDCGEPVLLTDCAASMLESIGA